MNVAKKAALPKDYTDLRSPVERIRVWMRARGHSAGGCDTIEDLLNALESSAFDDGRRTGRRDVVR